MSSAALFGIVKEEMARTDRDQAAQAQLTGTCDAVSTRCVSGTGTALQRFAGLATGRECRGQGRDVCWTAYCGMALHSDLGSCIRKNLDAAT